MLLGWSKTRNNSETWTVTNLNEACSKFSSFSAALDQLRNSLEKTGGDNVLDPFQATPVNSVKSILLS